MSGSCTCGVISIGNRGPDPSLPRNLDPDCPEHGDAATMARFDTMDLVTALRTARHIDRLDQLAREKAARRG